MRRLLRDRPDLAAQVEAGELSVRRLEIARDPRVDPLGHPLDGAEIVQRSAVGMAAALEVLDAAENPAFRLPPCAGLLQSPAAVGGVGQCPLDILGDALRLAPGGEQRSVGVVASRVVVEEARLFRRAHIGTLTPPPVAEQARCICIRPTPEVHMRTARPRPRRRYGNACETEPTETILEPEAVVDFHAVKV
jgi:hypothetical protein